MKPLEHAQRSVKHYGGTVDDYLPIHDFLDMSKAVHADMRHRALLHNSLGPFIAEQIFGGYLTIERLTDDPVEVSVRQIAEDHIMEDMGRIPNASEFLSLIPESEMFRFAFVPRHRRELNLAD